MIDNDYLFAKDDTRIFINTSLGCSGKCLYCYLPKVGYGNKDNNYKTISANNVIEMIEQSNYNLNNDTLITLGCFSECWDKNNKEETLKIIEYFLKRGNQIQLSTKKKISIKELAMLTPYIKYYGQLIIFISTTTISNASIIEKNTESIEKRFETFEILKNLNIPVILYIKPVLKNITIKDLDLYKRYIKHYNINDVVVGSIFTNNITDETVHFSNKNELFYTSVEDENIIISELSKICSVYRRSTEVTNYYKKKGILQKDIKIKKLMND